MTPIVFLTLACLLAGHHRTTVVWGRPEEVRESAFRLSPENENLRDFLYNSVKMLTVSALINRPLWQEFTRIENAVWIHCLFQSPHDAQCAGSVLGFQKLELAHPHTMFTAA